MSRITVLDASTNWRTGWSRSESHEDALWLPEGRCSWTTDGFTHSVSGDQRCKVPRRNSDKRVLVYPTRRADTGVEFSLMKTEMRLILCAGAFIWMMCCLP